MHEPHVRPRPPRTTTPPPFAYDQAALRSARGSRPENDDRALVRPDLGLYAIADGLGGAHGGALAATLAVDTLAAHYAPIAAETFSASAEALAARLAEAVSAANDVVRSARSGAFAAMGTTLVALARTRDHVALAHVGDSRALRLEHAGVVALTSDHSIRAVLRDHAPAGPFLARYGHLVTRALGCHARELDLELRVDALVHEPRSSAPRRYLLASDGLTEWVEVDELAACLEAPSPHEAARTLVARALTNGSDDNTTALVVDLVPWTRDDPLSAPRPSSSQARPRAR